ncbi:long-chain-acyl-CoA synthetase [Acinetobacter courvalinii]|uniref:long-chain-acyl-CoA synthetase n=1 Tax=Acinetobacter courvalinii TaxID=280147 RepID=UPI003F55C400
MQKNTFSLIDIATAGLRLLPNLPKVIYYNKSLSKLNPDSLLSTGLIFEKMAEKYPERFFLLFEDKKWTYKDFNIWVNQIAHALKRRGVCSGDCVGLMFENCPELLACTLAVNKLGAIAAMINYHQRDKILQHSINLVKPKILIVGDTCLDSVSSILSTLDPKILLFSYATEKEYFEYLSLSNEIADQPSINLSETLQIKLREKCYYIFTSGTTGLPKAASMTHYRWYKAGIAMGLMSMRLKSKDVMYCPLPLYHNNALTVALSSVINSGSALALSRKFSSTHFWEDIRKFEATCFIYVGELCRYLLNSPKQINDSKNKVRVIIGNGMRPEIWEDFQKRFSINHICEFYGASENSTAFVNLLNLKKTAGFGPMSYAIVRFDTNKEKPIIDSYGFMNKVNKGESGLLLTEVNRNIPFDGYNDRKATEAKLFRNVFQKGDCWFNTGDLVKDQGFRHISFVDRVGDTYRWKGENIATTEIEGVIQKFPFIAEAVVYGVEVPKTDGKAGMVAITLESRTSIDLLNLYKYLKSKLPVYSIPLFIRIQKKQECTETFKIKKSDLKKKSFRSHDPDSEIYVLYDKDQGYKKLTDDILHLIEIGQFKF